MIVTTKFMDDNAVTNLAKAYPTTYAPDIADHQSDTLDLMQGIQALVVRAALRDVKI